jgi:hypothetical protein
MFLIYQITFLVILQGAQIIKRSFLVKVMKPIFWITVAVSFGNSTLFSYWQYLAWKNGPLGDLLLPPHRSIAYFLEYSIWRFWTPALSALATALILILIVRFLNKKNEEKFFENEEPYLLGIGIVLVGYPVFLVYILTFFLLFLAVNIFKTVKNKSADRVSPYYLWLPAALIAIIVCELWLSHLAWWSLLII